MDALRNVRDLLAQETLSNFAAARTHVLYTLQLTSTVADAVKSLDEHKILSMPVLDESGEYVGCVSTTDVLRSLMDEFESALGVHWVDRMEEVTKNLLQEIASKFYGQTVNQIMHAGDLWLSGQTGTTLLDVCTEGFQVMERKVHHRVWVCDSAHAGHQVTEGATTVLNITPGSETAQATSMKPTHVVSQLDVIKFLCEPGAVEAMRNAGGKSLEELNAYLGSVLTVPASTTTLEAFHLMASSYKTCVGLVHEGRLVGNLSASDIRSLNPTMPGLLLLPVAEFVRVMHSAPQVVESALEGVHVPGVEQGDWSKVLARVPLVTLYPNNTLNQLLRTLLRNKLHRVYVVDDEDKPVSIITLTDILRLVVLSN